MIDFEKRITFPRGAWDRRDPDPHKNYGIGSCEAQFVLSGANGAIAWRVMMGWDLPHVRAEQGARDPMGDAVEIHSPKPLEHQQGDPATTDKCDLTGGECWIDCGFCAGDDFLTALIADGEAGVWKLAEEWYEHNFKPVEMRSYAP